MTPRELLATHYNSLEADDLLEWLDREGFMIVSKESIRAAGNDALERAAVWHDEKAKRFKASAVESVTPPLYLTEVSGIQDQMSDTHKECAAAIRALKHKI